MYELYDKNGNLICYRMTKRIKNDLGEYDVLTARSKKSEKECRKIMDDKIRDYYIQKETEKHKGVFPDMLFKDFADNWYELNVKNADCSQVNNVAKELMGHSDISVTAKIYTHMVDEVFEQNRKRLAEYANQKEQKAVNKIGRAHV